MSLSVIESLPLWQNVYLLAGGTAATLTGLLFVALSLAAGMTTTRGMPSLIRDFITPTVVHFTDVLFIAILCLVPAQRFVVLGIGAMLPALANLGWVSLVHRRYLQKYSVTELARQHRFWLLLLPVVCYLVLLGAGIGLMLGQSDALAALAIATGGLLVIGVRNAWWAMVWVTVQRSGELSR